MILSARTAAQFLRVHGLIPDEAFVDGDVLIEDVSKRNLNMRARSSAGLSFFLKQGIGQEGRDSVACEADVYAAIEQSGQPIRCFLPRLIGFDADDQVLMLEMVADAEDLEQYHTRLGRFPAGVGAALGHALAGLHAIEAPAEDGGRLNRAPAWALSFHHLGVEALGDLSPGNLEVASLVQRYPALGATFDNLSDAWRAEALCHFDLKWDNVLLASSRSDFAKRLRIIDWEAAGYGDPAWDVGCVLTAWLAFWVRSMAMTRGITSERLAETARHPLATMHHSIRAFWRSYVSGAELADAAAFLRRAMRYVAPRLVEEAVAQSQMAAGASSRARLLVQLAANVSQRPEQAVRLLGLDES
jgi:aminoglycoside phosphotransferase (APT) family kinase protein